MFFRQKKSGPRSYLQIVENRWEDGRSRQRVIATLGRMDKLRESGELDRLLRSGARFAEAALVISAHDRGEAPSLHTCRIGPALIFERLWETTGCRSAINPLLAGRKFEFAVERSIFLTVLHRLFDPGSDRQGDRWREGYRIAGTEGLELHHFYRAMAWLGEELPDEEQEGATPFSPRCTKDMIEERLFARRRDLFTSLDLVFFDTTSIYFEGEGGTTLGRHGHSKDHRPDLKQMVVGVVLSDDGHPLCCELWPGNTADVTSLVPIVDRLRTRFGIRRVCIVADRGMISKGTLEEIEKRGWLYILGARMRSWKEVRDKVLSRAGRYRVVHPKRSNTKDPCPLKVKEVFVEDRRYVVCLNKEEAAKDAHDRKAIVASLRQKLKQGDKSLVGNKGYRKYLETVGKRFQIDEQKIKDEARYDGKWVLRTNSELDTACVALKYKQLLVVEQLFRSIKSLLETRPIYHQRDETIRGHVFCSFLALVLLKELKDRLEEKNHAFEWADVVRDLDHLAECEIEQDGKRFVLRTGTQGSCAKVFQAVGVAIPPPVRQVSTRGSE